MSNYNDFTSIILAARVPLYALLQRAFGAPPDEGLFDLITDDRLRDCVDVLFDEVGNADARAAFKGIQENVAERRRNDAEAFLRSCKSEYTRLFIGPDKLAAPPWESVYRTGERAVLEAHPCGAPGLQRAGILASRLSA